MTALFMDGFDHYGAGAAGADAMLDGTWAQAGDPGPTIPSWGARTGTYALLNTRANDHFRYVLPAAKDVVYLSCGYASETLPLADLQNMICSFRTTGNAEIASLWLQSNGSIVLTRSGSVIAGTQGPVIVTQNWHFLEMEMDQDGGNFTLRVDDANASEDPVIEATGLSLGSDGTGQVWVLHRPAASVNYTNQYMDDLYIRDDAGTVNNSWLGDQRIAELLVEGDTATAGWSANRYHKIGAGILTATGASSCLGITSATDLNIGSSDFTLETFIRFNQLPTASNKSVIFSKWATAANQRSYQLFLGSQALNGGALCWQTSTDGTAATIAQPIVYPFTPDLDTWYHIAIVRASGQLLLFVNGEQYGLPIADASTYFAGTGAFGLGAELTTIRTNVIADTALRGWFDETRFTNGMARYTANFTPTTTEFPRGVTDPDWADVVLLSGYDSIIQDESGAAHAIIANGGAVQFTPNDAPSVGTWPVIGKASPDDNTFIEAPFVPATSILTITVLPTSGNTVTVGTENGTDPAVYKFVNTLVDPFDVLIDVSIEATLQNLYNAINAGPGGGTKYEAATTANFDVQANQLPAGQMLVTALIAGTVGNTIATTSSGITGGWTDTTLAGGLDIPGPSNFKVQRLPSNTTLISAVQITMRSFKTDAGIGSINSAFVGPLGGISLGDTHNLTVNPIYYNDIFETDPDTAGPISPTTITGGAIQIERDT